MKVSDFVGFCRRGLFAVLLGWGAMVALPAAVRGEELPRPTVLASGLKNPESVAVGGDGRIYVSVIGEFDTPGDGQVVVVANGKAQKFATGLDDPKGLAVAQDALFVADGQRVWKIDGAGKASVFVAADAFPKPPRFLNDLAIDDEGNLFVSDSGDLKGGEGAVYRITPQAEVSVVIDAASIAKLPPPVRMANRLGGPNGLLSDDRRHVLMLDFVTGDLRRIDVRDGSMTRIAASYPGGDGLARDDKGKLYVSEWSTGRVWVLGKESHAPTLIGQFESAADICLDAKQERLLVPDMKAGTLSAISLSGIPAVELDERPMPVRAARAFPNLEFDRPLVLTHAGDGSDRVFVASQLGKVFVLANDQQASEAAVYLDIKSRVRYSDNENEEGFLGLAFHPRYRENGELFVYYTTTDEPHTSVISRFHVSADDPNRADPDSEQELLRIPQPYWNHNGGTIVFGPDGYLYIGLGDGGKRDDPHGNGQNLGTLLGSILRIDVDHRAGKLAYAIPRDNPFVDTNNARGEIWAYGVRNIWRMAFDRETGELWAADVGQDIWEEIDIIVRGGNYGWNLREAKHKFGTDGSEARDDLIDPIFEYHHDVGKSITGGNVYRGPRVPELNGMYLYADYVTGKVYALRYDEAAGRVTANRPVPGNITPVFSFGEDEAGETYFMTTRGWLMRFEQGASPAAAPRARLNR
jgi:glucose/arabinose dehydrogenase